jgi:hypothetical protein
MASATKVVCDKEGNGNNCKSNEEEGDWQAIVMRAMWTAKATAKAMTWMMMMVTRLVGNKEGKDKVGKGNGDDDEGGGQG